MNKQQRIVAIIRAAYEKSVENYRHTHAEWAAEVGAANAWDSLNTMDGIGGMSQNPYNINHAAKRDNEARIHMLNIKECYDFAVDTFLEGI